MPASRRWPRVAVAILAAHVMLTSAAAAYTLLFPARRWHDTPRLVHVDQRGLASVAGADPDGGVSAALSAVTAWNSDELTPVAATPDAPAFMLGDGRSDLLFEDPLELCTGNCIAATIIAFFDTGRTQSCGAINVAAITDADIVFNTDFDFTTESEGSACAGEVYLEAVVTHEVGHLIGLGHSSVLGALMYPVIPYCVDKQLAQDDLAGRTVLYACTCPATAALTGVEGATESLELLREFRDTVLSASPLGRRAVYLFYEHAAEGAGILMDRPDLLGRARDLLMRIQPAIRASVEGRPARIGGAERAEIFALLEEARREAGPELRDDLGRLRAEMLSGRLLALIEGADRHPDRGRPPR